MFKSFSFLFIYLSCFITLSLSHFAYAEATPIAEQLTSLKKVKNKASTIETLESLIKSPEIIPEQYVSALNMLGRAYLTTNNFNRAIENLQQAQVIAQSQHFIALESESFTLLGIIYYYQGKYTQAISAYQQAISYYQTIDAPIKQASLYNNLALVYSSMSNYLLALKNYQLAEALYQNFGSEEDKIDVRYNIALMHVNMKQYDVAIKMLLEVLNKRESLSDQNTIAMIWAHLGVAYKHSGQYQASKKYLLDALTYFQKENDRFQIAAQLHNIAELYHQLNQPEKAKEYAEKGIIVSLAIDHKKAYAGSLNSLAKAYFYQGDIEQALNKITLANQVAREMGYQSLLNSNLALLSLIYATQKNTAEALTTHLEYTNKQIKINNALLNVQLARFESEQLAQQVEKLTQNKKLQQLKNKESEQLQYFITFSIIFILLCIFFIFRKKIEKTSNQKIDSKVKQKTKELDRLVHELQDANKLKSQYLINITSDIRTPLKQVIELSELMLKGKRDSQESQVDITHILENSRQSLQLINDIIDLEEIETNTLELALKHQDINLVLTEILEMFTEPAINKGLEFEIDNNLPTPFIVYFDANRLKKILINFCSNAIKFTREGKITLRISQESNQLIISVHDTGIGMNKVQLKQLFDSFDQHTPNRKLAASGLGLFVAEQLASIMGGNISAQSDLGRGSTFTFTLPLNEKIE